MLAMPQHLDLNPLLPRHASDSLLASPFAQVLRSDDPAARPEAFVLIGGGSTPPLSRLWCCCESMLAVQAGVPSVTVESPTTSLLHGTKLGQALEAAEAAATTAREDAAAAVMAKMEVAAYTAEVGPNKKAAKRAKEADRRATESAVALASAQLAVLSAKSSELLELELATCHKPTDRAAIREHFRKNSMDACRRQVAALIRQSVCGLRVATKDLTVIDGPLGALPLAQETVTLGGKGLDFSAPDRVMHLAKWLWSRPAVVTLDLSGCQPHRPEVPRAVCHALASGSLRALQTLNLDGTALPVQELSGASGVETIDLSSHRLGVASGIAIAALIVSNSTIITLRLSNNALRDEGIGAIARALKGHLECAMRTLECANTRFGVSGAMDVAAAVAKMPALTTLDISNNRMCGVWVDQYGQQGVWSAAAVHALAEAIRGSHSLTTLLVGGNRIRDEGVKAIVGALRDDAELTRLGDVSCALNDARTHIHTADTPMILVLCSHVCMPPTAVMFCVSIFSSLSPRRCRSGKQ